MKANKKVFVLVIEETPEIFSLKWITFVDVFPTTFNKIVHLDPLYEVVTKLLFRKTLKTLNLKACNVHDNLWFSIKTDIKCLNVFTWILHFHLFGLCRKKYFDFGFKETLNSKFRTSTSKKLVLSFPRFLFSCR